MNNKTPLEKCSKSLLCDIVAFWTYHYFDAESTLNSFSVADKEDVETLENERDKAKQKLFEALAEYGKRYALCPFVVPQEATPVKVPKNPLDMNFLTKKNKAEC